MSAAAAPLSAQQASASAATEPITIPAGVPLHIRATHTAHLHTGTPVLGVLTQPIYVRDRLVLPIGSPVQGTVTAYAPVERLVREQALLNGDVTPLHDPVVDFTTVHLDGATTDDSAQDIPLDSRALVRDTQIVRFSAAKKPSLIHQAIDIGKQRVREAYDAVFAPGKKDRALQLLYGQLPYHPQRIWAGTQFVAELIAPATVMLSAEPPTPEATDDSLNGITVDARLADPLDSSTAKKGDPVTAIITAPVFDANGNLILPEGAQLDGLVSATKPARSFGRNGQLRFAIRGVRSFGLPANSTTAAASTPPADSTAATTPEQAAGASHSAGSPAPPVETLNRPAGSSAHAPQDLTRPAQELHHPEEREVYGTVTGAEGNAGESLSVDSEGNVKANPDQNRFVAPLLLAVTAIAGQDQDHDHGGDGGGGGSSIGNTTVASNGFGLVARVIGLVVANPNVATGFGAYGFAKSIYFRFLIRGHEVSFPRDTQVEVTLSSR